MKTKNNIKVYETYKNGKLIQAKKKYINKNTYDIEEYSTNNNFGVDSSIAEIISLLNKKGYKTISSKSLKVHDYRINKKYYEDKDLLLDSFGNKFIPIALSSTGYYVKYQLLETKKINDEKIGTFKIISQITQCQIVFDKDYNFSNLPKYFDYLEQGIFNKNIIGTALIRDDFDKRFYENRNFEDYEDIQKEIDKINNELLKWIESLPIQKGI